MPKFEAVWYDTKHEVTKEAYVVALDHAHALDGLRARGWGKQTALRELSSDYAIPIDAQVIKLSGIAASSPITKSLPAPQIALDGLITKIAIGVFLGNLAFAILAYLATRIYVWMFLQSANERLFGS